MTPAHTLFEIEPLTKKGEDGNLYFRRKDVLEQLESLVNIDPAELERRVRILREADEGSIKSENLVHLMRTYHGLALESAIYETLAHRVKGIAYRRTKLFRADAVESGEDFVQSVLLGVLEKVLDFSSDSGQFAQVSFGDFVVGIVNNKFKAYRTVLNKSNVTDSIDEDSDDDSEFIRTEILLTARITDPLEKLNRDRMLSLLPEEIREACILRMEGWQISSNDPNEVTIAKAMGVSDRTIRNWFKKAAGILAENGYSLS